MATDRELYYKEKIVEYLSRRKGGCSQDSVIKYVLEQKNIGDAILIAAVSRDAYGRKHSHQHRLEDSALHNFALRLHSHVTAIENATDFEQLISIVEKNKTHGIGEMAIYDTAFRIGAYKNIFPDKIYLHKGTKIGVERFMRKTIHKNSILKQELYAPFNICELIPWQLEDFFCIYKDIFLE